VILVLEEGLSLDAIHRVEAMVRRAGGEPRRLVGRGADGGAVDGRDAIEAKGGDARMLRAVPGVALLLDAHCAYPRVARQEGLATAVNVPPGRPLATLGGGGFALIAGPCAVESAEQLDACAQAAKDAGATMLRGGAWKPRTSPYSFQGLGPDGLYLLRQAATRHGLAVVTEVMDTDAIAQVAEHADMLQIGSRNMQNFALLRAVGRQRRPVLLKRGLSATLEEWLLAAEYVADAGNDQIVLCERGVRSFDPASRNLLDLAAIPLLRERTRLPVVVDPSHGTGVRSAIPAMCLAAVAAGADGVMLECHPDPGCAKSDGFQALSLEELQRVGESVLALRAHLASRSRTSP
jgi:3-deoxy-7-phosphoheptulonate synthase